MDETKKWTVDIRGPHGVKSVEISDGLVRIMQHEVGTSYMTAAWLAYTDLWTEADNDRTEGSNNT